jgi:hypothetical protein
LAELRAWIDHRALDVEARIDRQHVEAGGGAEGHLPGEQLEIARDRLGRQRAILVAEGDDAARLAGGAQRDAEQLQEFGAVPLGDLVGPVDQILGQEGEQLDDGDAGIGGIEVGPFGRVDGDAGERLVDQGAIVTIVDAGGGQRHQPLPNGIETLVRSAAPVETRR